MADPTPTAVDEVEAETPKITHDSMVTVRLSEPPALTLDTDVAFDSKLAARIASYKSPARGGRNKNISRGSTTTLSTTDANRSLRDELGQCGTDDGDSECSEEVNWEQLEKTEDEQTKNDETDNSTALLLARLEQENAKLATNPKSVKVQSVNKSSASKPRLPSMAQLRKMVNGPTPSALRYSMLPPPPMTDLEFYAALVKDYQQTAARLPTLLSNKIRKGIPPPLRGVVWQSMSAAHDAALEEQYERFCGESSPYELLIGKDLGRSFPGVDMFRDPEGDGQRMLGHVLKCFSLYDTKIGYCQGLAFLVGPLLMHMPDKQAFCVLVRLMERYDLRSCFLPDLCGLHVRIYQFRELLRINLPSLWSHMEALQVETAYVSQWFLSFFATTCPLPMLFRIYDVIFAEGASETLMRVSLSLMRRNEARLLACVELEDVMQLLLSRGLWDCYHYNADEFVQDFVSLGSIVTREKLAQLEQGHRESLVATTNVARTSDIATAASRFLGRIWAPSANTSPKSANLTPGLSAPSRPLSMLRRSTSKQSLASTLNSIEASSVSVMSSSSTDATTMSRDSSNAEDDPSSRESTPVGPKTTSNTKNADDKYLHSQIEDLLTALSELQRNHALLSNDLQREREGRDEDRETVRSLLNGLRKASLTDDVKNKAEASVETKQPGTSTGDSEEDRALPLSEETERPTDEALGCATDTPSTEALSKLLDRVESRFATPFNRQSSTSKSKSQLQAELAQAKDQLASAMSQSQDFGRRIHNLDQEIASLREHLRESHGHVRTLHQDKQRLEKQMQTLRARTLSGEPVANREVDTDWANKGAPGGLREFKLGRSKSIPSQGANFNKRQSSLPQNSECVAPVPSSIPAPTPAPAPSSEPAPASSPAEDTEPTNDYDALLLELVQAKTAEAMARQEADESKQKLEALRKACGLALGNSPGASLAVGAVAAGAMGVFGRLTGQGTVPASDSISNGRAGVQREVSSPGTGGFWGWRR